jgi:hypothetical protein
MFTLAVGQPSARTSLMDLSTIACIDQDDRAQHDQFLRRDYVVTKFAHRPGKLANALVAKNNCART